MNSLIKRIAGAIAVGCICATVIAAEQPERHTGFGWGADVGGAVDMGGHDMSTIDIDAYFGFHTPIFHIIGIGAGINMPVDNSYRTFPVYAIAQTSFISRPQPVFFDLRAGCVINERPDGGSSCDFYLSPGVGFRLAYGKTYSSYLTVGYLYNGMHGKGYIDSTNKTINNLNAAVIRLGIRF